jgi:hypothetical protein
MENKKIQKKYCIINDKSTLPHFELLFRERFPANHSCQ